MTEDAKCAGILRNAFGATCSRRGKLYCAQHDPGDEADNKAKRMAAAAAEEERRQQRENERAVLRARETVVAVARGWRYGGVDGLELRLAVEALVEAEARTRDPKEEKDGNSRPAVSIKEIHESVAHALGWKIEDVQSFSLNMLRVMVREKHPKLAREITLMLESRGHYFADDVSESPGDERLPQRGAKP